MIKGFINQELKVLPIEGIRIHFIEECVVRTPASEFFRVSRLSDLLINSGTEKLDSKRKTDLAISCT